MILRREAESTYFYKQTLKTKNSNAECKEDIQDGCLNITTTLVSLYSVHNRTSTVNSDLIFESLLNKCKA